MKSLQLTRFRRYFAILAISSLLMIWIPIAFAAAFMELVVQKLTKKEIAGDWIHKFLFRSS